MLLHACYIKHVSKGEEQAGMVVLFGSLITGHKRVNLQYLFPNVTSLLGIKMVNDLKPHEVFHSCAELTSGATQLLWAKPAGNSWYRL